MIPFDRLLTTPMPCNVGSPTCVPNIQVPPEIQQLVPIIASIAQNEIVTKAATLQTRAYLFNACSFNNYDNTIWRELINFLCSYLHMGIRKNQINLQNIQAQLTSIISGGIDLYLAKLVNDNDQLMSRLQPNIQNNIRQNCNLLNSVLNELNMFRQNSININNGLQQNIPYNNFNQTFGMHQNIPINSMGNLIQNVAPNEVTLGATNANIDFTAFGNMFGNNNTSSINNNNVIVPIEHENKINLKRSLGTRGEVFEPLRELVQYTMDRNRHRTNEISLNYSFENKQKSILEQIAFLNSKKETTYVSTKIKITTSLMDAIVDTRIERRQLQKHDKAASYWVSLVYNTIPIISDDDYYDIFKQMNECRTIESLRSYICSLNSSCINSSTKVDDKSKFEIMHFLTMLNKMYSERINDFIQIKLEIGRDKLSIDSFIDDYGDLVNCIKNNFNEDYVRKLDAFVLRLTSTLNKLSDEDKNNYFECFTEDKSVKITAIPVPTTILLLDMYDSELNLDVKNNQIYTITRANDILYKAAVAIEKQQATTDFDSVYDCIVTLDDVIYKIYRSELNNSYYLTK